jgi:hypothetical protein
MKFEHPAKTFTGIDTEHKKNEELEHLIKRCKSSGDTDFSHLEEFLIFDNNDLDKLLNQIEGRNRMLQACSEMADENIIPRSLFAFEHNLLSSSDLNIGIIERFWFCKKKPFFNVWPKVAEALLKTNLHLKPKDIPSNVISDLGCLRIKLPVGFSVAGMTDIGIYISIQYGKVNYHDASTEIEGKSIVVYAFSGVQGEPSEWCQSYQCPFDEFIDEAEVNQPESVDDKMKAIVRLCIGVMLLASDPEFIHPLLLSKDRGKKDDDGKLHEKAKKRGVFGYEIGREFQVSPHVRRPHFAIRWTGKNGKIPKLVPVKGCVVSRKKLTEIPTGYEGAE